MRAFRAPLLVVMTLVVAVFACGGGGDVATKAPPTEVAVAAGDGYASGGLGLSEADWEGTAADSVELWDGNVWYLERAFGEQGLTLEEARAEGTRLIPEDSELVETYSPEGIPELVVDLYLSESLTERFEDHSWPGGEPGNFTVIYGVFDERVPRVVIGTGNQP